MNPRILVVDDHEDTLTMYRNDLVAAGFDVEATTSPNHALSLVMAKPCVLAVLDIAMPALDGRELARLLRSYGSTRHMRLVAVSAYAFDFSPQEMPFGGWDACLRKPCEPSVLVSTVTGILAANVFERNAKTTAPSVQTRPRDSDDS